MENVLGVLGTRFGTDKVSGHNYHLYYHDVLNHLRDKPIHMLEVGVQHFNSIDMWKAYFPLAKIYGIDINKEYKDDRICIYRADQSNRDQLNSVISQMKTRCDFINDDGSHIPEHQILTFDLFFTEVLNYGGVYIIEDIETSYWKRNGLYGYETRYGYQHPNSLIEKFKHVCDYVNKRFLGADDLAMLKEKLTGLSPATLDAISSITFAQNCIIIKKKLPTEFMRKTAYHFAENVV
jgi:hypothetical protein